MKTKNELEKGASIFLTLAFIVIVLGMGFLNNTGVTGNVVSDTKFSLQLPNEAGIDIPIETIELTRITVEELPKEKNLFLIIAVGLLAVFLLILLYRIYKRIIVKIRLANKAVELSNFIVHSKSKGIPTEEIRIMLIKEGWPEKILREYLEKFGK